MAEHHHKSPQELAQEIRTAVHGVTGLGDVIRGTVNSTLDEMFPGQETDESRAKNAAVTNKGYADVEAAEKLFAAHDHHHSSEVGSHQGTSNDAVTTEITPVAHNTVGVAGETEETKTTAVTNTGPGANVNSGVKKPASGTVNHEGISPDAMVPETGMAGATGTGTGTSIS